MGGGMVLDDRPTSFPQTGDAIVCRRARLSTIPSQTGVRCWQTCSGAQRRQSMGGKVGKIGP